jgi:hypothetical protein
MTQSRVGGFLAEGVLSRWLAIALTATEAPRFSTTGSKVTERAGEEGLADTDGSEDDDVAVSGDEAQRAELLEHAPIERDFRRLVPSLESAGRPNGIARARGPRKAT